MGRTETGHYPVRHRHAGDGWLRNGEAHTRNGWQHAHLVCIGIGVAQGCEEGIRRGGEQLREEALCARRNGCTHPRHTENEGGKQKPERNGMLQLRTLYTGRGTRHPAQQQHGEEADADRKGGKDIATAGRKQERGGAARSHPEPLLGHGR